MSSKGRSVRLPDALWERIEEMVERLQDDPEAVLHGKVNRSKVIRLALNHGLAVLERRHPGKPRKGGK